MRNAADARVDARLGNIASVTARAAAIGIIIKQHRSISASQHYFETVLYIWVATIILDEHLTDEHLTENLPQSIRSIWSTETQLLTTLMASSEPLTSVGDKR